MSASRHPAVILSLGAVLRVASAIASFPTPPHSGYHLSGRASGFEGWYHRLTVDDASPSSTPSLMRRTKRARGTAATCRCAVPMGGHMARRPSCELLGRRPQACSRQVLSRCRLLENGLASGLRPLRAGRIPAQQHPAPGRAARWIRPVELRGRASGRRLVPSTSQMIASLILSAMAW